MSERIGEQGNKIEERIAAIWRHVLQRNEIAVDKDFHALGGDSLSTMNLALEIENAFGVIFSVDDLASTMTVTQLAIEVRARLGYTEPGATRPYGECETSSKVFAISYPWIMKHMPDEIGQALSSGRWRHVQVPFTYFRTASAITVEGMADCLERMICSMSPEGPYILYGQCFTGLLAYEVARRLVAAGHSVSMVVLVDCYPRIPTTLAKLPQSLGRRAARFAKLNIKSQMTSLGRKFVRNVGPVNFIREACERARAQYRPYPYRGRVTVFRHNNESEFALYQDYDGTIWRRLVLGELIEHFVNMYDDEGRFSNEVLHSAYNEIAAKLRRAP